MALRAVGIASAVVIGALTAVCASAARAAPVEIDLTIFYQYPPNPALPAVQLTGSAELWQFIDGSFVPLSDVIDIGSLSVSNSFITNLFPPNPCSSVTSGPTSCEIGFSFGGMTGAVSAFALEQFDPSNPPPQPDVPPIIPIGMFEPPDPCYQGAICHSSGPIVAFVDAPVQVGTWAVTIQAETPLPAALPLFATGLGALGLLGWRRKRKAECC